MTRVRKDVLLVLVNARLDVAMAAQVPALQIVQAIRKILRTKINIKTLQRNIKNRKKRSCTRHKLGYNDMIKNLFCIVTLITTLAITGNAHNMPKDFCVCKISEPNESSYMRTNKSVKVYTESGYDKGSFAVYLHQGRKYIDFNDTWICIQGKMRFAYKGNWYVIK